MEQMREISISPIRAGEEFCIKRIMDPYFIQSWSIKEQEEESRGQLLHSSFDLPRSCRTQQIILETFYCRLHADSIKTNPLFGFFLQTREY